MRGETDQEIGSKSKPRVEGGEVEVEKRLEEDVSYRYFLAIIHLARQLCFMHTLLYL